MCGNNPSTSQSQTVTVTKQTVTVTTFAEPITDWRGGGSGGGGGHERHGIHAGHAFNEKEKRTSLNNPVETEKQVVTEP